MADQINDRYQTKISNQGQAEVKWIMSLRDYFAGQALAGELAAQSELTGICSSVADMKVIAGNCYAMADAMLAERSKP